MAVGPLPFMHLSFGEKVSHHNRNCTFGSVGISSLHSAWTDRHSVPSVLLDVIG